jgi:phosphopantothenoylcysteine decarboxylase/phosphopantothenate--cysteine ligase
MRKIVLGVTGSIAAYKSLEIVRKFRKAGEDVVCVLTKGATEFVTPLSFSTLSNNDVVVGLFEPRRAPIHISLAECDLILVVPATYNFIGKIASGIADDPLSCAIAASSSPVVFAPCMETRMWGNELFQQNVSKLKSMGYEFIDPEVGELSTLKIGKGRFPEPDLIVAESYRFMNRDRKLDGKKVVVTAGRTEEDLDPVRCVTNRSSGIMGYEIAREARLCGADVTLISGPSAAKPPSGIKLIGVRTASELADEVLSSVSDSDILVMAAAVANYAPTGYCDSKIKTDHLTVEFRRTQDILKLVRAKRKKAFVVGFCLETEDHVKRASVKLEEKSLDLIATNDVSTLSSSEARFTLINKKLKTKELPLLPKSEAAKEIVDWIAEEYQRPTDQH